MTLKPVTAKLVKEQCSAAPIAVDASDKAVAVVALIFIREYWRALLVVDSIKTHKVVHQPLA